MAAWQALALGIVQGITEFLPVSSSGHLLLVKVLFGIDLQAVPLLFDVGLHGATLGVILFYLRKRIWLWCTLCWPKAPISSETRSGEWRLIQEFIVATVATALVGYIVGRVVPLNNLRIAAAGFALTALFLLGQHRFRVSGINDSENAMRIPRFSAALLIGIVQGCTVLPGISRAGATICAALMVGLQWRRAVDFSFLLAIPAILGALVFSIAEYQQYSQNLSLSLLLIGMLAALVVGSGALRLLLFFVRKSYIHFFVPYLILLSIVSFLLSR